MDYDKATIENRAVFATEHLDEWLVWAEDPVKYKDWQKVDDPFNFLAALIEVKAAIDSGDRYSYRTGLMIAWDATCSGLQVLTALSRDRKSALECNLTDTDIRGDYYTMIADKVWEDCKFTKAEEKSYQKTLAKFIHGIDEANRQIKLAKGKEAKRRLLKLENNIL